MTSIISLTFASHMINRQRDEIASTISNDAIMGIIEFLTETTDRMHL
jgi:hypothetical protein